MKSWKYTTSEVFPCFVWCVKVHEAPLQCDLATLRWAQWLLYCQLPKRHDFRRLLRRQLNLPMSSDRAFNIRTLLKLLKSGRFTER